jgi:hypothetical protein
MITFSISGSITTNDPISASYVDALNVDGIVDSASVAISASYAPSSGGGIGGMAYFTSSSIWTVPNGVTTVRVIAIGSGGGSNGVYYGGGGGYAEDVISVVGFTTLPVTVGLPGNVSITGSDGNLGDGNFSGFMNMTASGGSGGKYGIGIGGTGYNATIIEDGQNALSNKEGLTANNITLAGRGGSVGSNGQRGAVIIYY